MKKYALNYKGFEQYLDKVQNPNLFGRVTYYFRFENGYGAHVSVYRDTRYRTLWSVSVLDFHKKEYGKLWFNNPICNDVEVYLTDKDVRKLMQEIKDYTD